jgi:hypothetical protein
LRIELKERGTTVFISFTLLGASFGEDNVLVRTLKEMGKLEFVCSLLGSLPPTAGNWKHCSWQEARQPPKVSTY